LLNTDYKILAKALAKRLQMVLNDIINLDQSGCIKGRSSFTNIRSTLDIINYTNENSLPGILAFIDYEKAFDTVKWPFLYKCLQSMNFGNTFIQYIKTLYSDIGTFIANCGMLSEEFKPTRGIRQGCPISANLFVLLVETMANAIRQNARITGIRIGQKECKISQFAIDTCLYVADIDSLMIAFKVLEIFSKCSGLKVNCEKSEAMGIGATSNYRHKGLGIKWPKDSIKCLGIFLNNDTTKVQEDNFQRVLGKIEDLLNIWNLRKLTLKGKIIIVNTLIIPQLLYVCSVLHTPQSVKKKFHDLLIKFIWNNKPPKVKYKCIISKIEDGGLKLQDVDSKIRSLKIKWLKAIYDTNSLTTWKCYLNTYFTEDIAQVMSYDMSMNDYPIIGDKFYQDLLETWAELHCYKPEHAEEMCRQQVCNNTLIRINNMPISKKVWIFFVYLRSG
jgi:hypothetical protein